MDIILTAAGGLRRADVNTLFLGDTLVMGPVGKLSQGMMGAVPEKSP